MLSESSNETGNTWAENISGLRKQTFRELAISDSYLSQDIKKYIVGSKSNTLRSPELKNYENSQDEFYQASLCNRIGTSHREGIFNDRTFTAAVQDLRCYF